MSGSIVSTGILTTESLKDKTILITGGAGGIGYATAESILWLGGNVVIADIDRTKLRNAKAKLVTKFGKNRVSIIKINISKRRDVRRLGKFVRRRYSSLDAIINNATVAHLGEVHTVDINKWDNSYGVNLRATVMLIQEFLPDMLEKNCGTIVFVPSSGAAPYMGAYEVFKTAQVELCNTLCAELEGTKINTYSIGPGYVKTDTAVKASEFVSQLMGLTKEEFYKMNDKHTIGVDAAGAGFAASLVFADKYNGQEIGSIQALMDAHINIGGRTQDTDIELQEVDLKQLVENLECVVKTFEEQHNGWIKRNIFEKQWIQRDFKKETGLSTEQMKGELTRTLSELKVKEVSSYEYMLSLIKKLKEYYNHQAKLLQSYEKDSEKLTENMKIIKSWVMEIDRILNNKNR